MKMAYWGFSSTLSFPGVRPFYPRAVSPPSGGGAGGGSKECIFRLILADSFAARALRAPICGYHPSRAAVSSQKGHKITTFQ